MNERQSARKSSRPLIIIAVLILIIAIWFITGRRNDAKMIEPSGSETPASDKGIPPDSLHH